MASGKGTNALNLIHYLRKNNKVKIRVLVCDNPKAEILKSETAIDIPLIIIPKESLSKQEHEEEILKALDKYNVDWVLLAGYRKILSSHFLKNFWNKDTLRYQVINIHPSLLPEFPGRDAYKQVYESSKLRSGVTVHYVDTGVDTGPKIYQESFMRTPGESLQELVTKGKAIEHRAYPKALEIIWNL